MKLNLGCGTNLFPQAEGWVNVDKYGEPDVLLDLATTCRRSNAICRISPIAFDW